MLRNEENKNDSLKHLDGNDASKVDVPEQKDDNESRKFLGHNKRNDGG